MHACTGLYKPRQGTAGQQHCPHAVLLGRGALSELLKHGGANEEVNGASRWAGRHGRTVLEMRKNFNPPPWAAHPKVKAPMGEHSHF